MQLTNNVFDVLLWSTKRDSQTVRFYGSNFFWQGDNHKKKIKSYRLTKWGVLCLPKEQGGLGIIDLVTQNACLLTLYINQ
jgi:hypothetical protein